MCCAAVVTVSGSGGAAIASRFARHVFNWDGRALDRGDTYIVTTEETNNFAVSVELAEDPLLHVLQQKRVISEGPGPKCTQ